MSALGVIGRRIGVAAGAAGAVAYSRGHAGRAEFVPLADERADEPREDREDREDNDAEPTA